MPPRLKKILRRALHALAASLLLVALASAFLWLRSRTHWDYLAAGPKSWYAFASSYDGRCIIGWPYDRNMDSRKTPGQGFLVVSDTWSPPSAYPWSYTHIGPGVPSGWGTATDILGTSWSPSAKENWLAIPYSYSLAASLTCAALWFWHVGKSRQRFQPGHCPTCGYNLCHSKLRCPECGTPIPKL